MKALVCVWAASVAATAYALIVKHNETLGAITFALVLVAAVGMLIIICRPRK